LSLIGVQSFAVSADEGPPAGGRRSANSSGPRERPSAAAWQSPPLGGTGRDPHITGPRPSLARVDTRKELREFLISRRGKVTPQQAGLPTYGGHRRVPGLRREEAALLAGVSVEYYTRLERGNAQGVSDGVLEALARALQLDEAERTHLVDLIRAAGTTRPLRRAALSGSGPRCSASSTP
jgi:transcriptional regulator with XRE-family HTH domain